MSHNIKHWYPKDQRFFHVLAISGNITKEDANTLNISDNRLKNFIREGYIREQSFPSSNHQQVESNKYYCYTQKGKDFVKEKYHISRTQNPFAAEHNTRMAHEICQLSHKEIDSCIPEWEVRDLWESRLNELEQGEADYWREQMNQGNLSPCDFVYISSEGVTVGVEITTSNYNEVDIQMKEESGTFLGIETQYVSVR